jgi:hypothetical protein
MVRTQSSAVALEQAGVHPDLARLPKSVVLAELRVYEAVQRVMRTIHRRTDHD